MTTKTDTKSAVRTLTTAEHTTVLDLLASLHAIVGSPEFSAKGTGLAPFAELNTEGHGFVLSRTLAALTAKSEEIARALVAGAKEKIDALAHECRTKRIKAWRG